MFGNPTLLTKFGIDWTLAKCFALAGVALALLAGIFFVMLFRHTKGKVRRLDPGQAGNIALYPSMLDYDANAIQSKGVGYEVELTASIRSLRKAAQRGDWLTFWLWPAMMCSWFVGMWLVFVAAAEALEAEALVGVVATISLAPLVLLALFMPWAALHTKIDLDEPSSKTGGAKARVT